MRKAGQDLRVVRCVLLTQSAATSQRRAPAPRQRCIFLKQTATAAARGQRASVQRTGTGGGANKLAWQQLVAVFCLLGITTTMYTSNKETVEKAHGLCRHFTSLHHIGMMMVLYVL